MFYEQKVDLRSRSAMQEFLKTHHRYYTVHCVNGRTSYAQCIKLYRLGLSREQIDRAFEILETEFWDEIRDPIDDFTAANGGGWTIGSSGRSGGYLVLYSSALEDTGYRSWCPSCGQHNYQPVSAGGDRCGRCGETRQDLKKPIRQLRVSCKGIDQGEDFSEWPIDRLRGRVRLVCEFDRACDAIRAEFIRLCETAEVVDEEFVVTKTRKVLSTAA